MLALVSGGSAPSSTAWAGISMENSAWSCWAFVAHTRPLSSITLLLISVLAFLIAVVRLVLYCADTTFEKVTAAITSTIMAKAPASETMNPQSDFKGDVKVNDHPPTKEDLERVAMLPVLDVNKKSHTFKSLWADDENGSRRVLVIFIRHFFCGVCAS